MLAEMQSLRTMAPWMTPRGGGMETSAALSALHDALLVRDVTLDHDDLDLEVLHLLHEAQDCPGRPSAAAGDVHEVSSSMVRHPARYAPPETPQPTGQEIGSVSSEPWAW